MLISLLSMAKQTCKTYSTSRIRRQSARGPLSTVHSDDLNGSSWAIRVGGVLRGRVRLSAAQPKTARDSATSRS